MATFTPMSIGSEIKKAREAERYSQRQLAEVIGCTQQEISKYESGNSIPSIERLEKIAKILKRRWKLSK